MLNQYVDIVPALTYNPVDDETWEIIDEWEGLTEEFDVYDRNKWVMAELPITDEDSNELKQETENIQEKFNQFDTMLKNKYNMKYIDLIDYQNGIVKIVSVK